MSKLSFRARALDPSKPMPIYLAEELPDLPEYSAINRAVPQMPSGMEKEEESEHHLQRAICTGLIIPTPEVFEATDSEFYEKYYPTDYKMPKQMIHMQPLNLEQDVPDYDMDSADEQWVNTQGKRLDLDPLKFETMMDRLEKSSGQTVVTLNEAKALLKQDDELSIAVYDYWLNKRLKTQHPLILSVKTETRGNTTPNNPYLAFRRRTEKMQTRKNRKNDESSYEKMLKLRRDLSRAVTLLEMIKRREKIKREQLHLGIEIYEKRYQTQDFNGQLLSEFTANATKASRPAFAPIYSNQYSSHHSAMSGSAGAGTSGSGAYHGPSSSSSHYHHVGGTSSSKRDSESLSSSRKEKRQYKKRKHKIQKERSSASSSTVTGSSAVGLGSSAVGTGGVGGYHHYQYHPAGTGVSGLSGIAASSGVGGRGDAALGTGLGSGTVDPALSSDEEELANLQGATAPEEEYAYPFRRSKLSQYHRPITKGFGDWPWVSKEENGKADLRYRFALTSLRHPRPRCIGFARRRIGRGGRVIIDRVSTDLDDLWSRLDYKIIESETTPAAAVAMEPEEESIVIPVPSSAGASALTAPTATATSNPTTASATTAISQMERKWNELESALAVKSGVKRTRQLVIKEETDMDDLFMANFGLARRIKTDGLVKMEEEDSVNSRLIGEEVEVKQEKCSDERTSVAVAAGGTSSSTFVISSNNGSSSSTSVSVNNSENNVIKSEAGGIVTVKQEVLEDYEHMIDNVNNSYRNRISNNSNSNSSSSSSSSNVNSRNNFNQSFSNSINNSLQNRAVSQYQQQLLQRSLRALQRKTAAPGLMSSASPDASSSSRWNDELGLSESTPSADSKAIASVYTELLNDIQSSWLHFRPKTPEPMLQMEDGLLDDDPLFQTDANRIALELQALDAELPGDIFNSTESVYRTKNFALDSLVEPHPLGLESAAVTKDATDELGIKLETCSNSDNNLSGDSLNDLNLSLSESNEDEKMLDKILQECQIDDMKSLNQTSNFWNGILEDGILNQLETADETGAGTGGDVKEDPLTINELVSPSPVEGLPVHKIGYCSELVGYDRLANVERYKSKRRKILKRCNYLVGSSFFAVRNPPSEEIFKKLSDGDGNVPLEGEKAEGAAEAAPTADSEVKVEEDSDSVSATIPADQIKIEPPDELLAACSPSASSQSAPHLQTNTSVPPVGSSYQQHSLSAPQIKLEPINYLQAVSHSTAVAATASPATASTSFLITSPSVQVVSQATTTVLNPLVASSQTTVPVVTAQHQQQQHPQHSTLTGQITLAGNAGSASSSGTSTPTGSYIVQHTTPIVLSQQQMQQIATSGGNIVTVSGNQMLTATKQALQQGQQQQHIQLQHATHSHQGETYVLTTATPTGQSPLKKQINGPNDKTVKQNVINPKLHTLINQKLAASGQKASDLSKKQFEMITKALVSQKMIVKSATAANHGSSAATAAAAQVVQQQQLQQQQQGTSGTGTYSTIQNAAGLPITILSATSQNPQQATQNKIILTSSPQLIQQAAGQLMAAAAAASPHGKISINSNLLQQQQGQQLTQFQTTDGGQGQTTSGTTGGQQQQNVKFEKAVNMLFDADKNRIVYANIKNSRGQFLAQLNPKVVNIIQPIQQQKLINSVGAMQQQQQQQTAANVQSILGASPTGTTTFVNSKGGIQRIPSVSIRAQQLQQQQQQQQQGQQQLDSHGTATVAVATNNATNSIKFIQVTPAVASAASSVVSENQAVSSSGSGGLVVPSSSGAVVGTAGSGTNTAAPTSINITNR
uniref:Enhancer of polycomb-like protein n=1 Tax=Aedes aegypti TaxID=7159 RepID=A0A0P6K0V3_AEDAE